MRVANFALVLLSQLRISGATEAYNLTGVEDQISAYLDQNPSLEARTLGKIGCAVAVRMDPFYVTFAVS